MKGKFTGSQLGLRKHHFGCECGVVGELFISNGEFYAGHFCQSSKRWVMKKAPGIDQRDILELYDKIYHIGTGQP